MSRLLRTRAVVRAPISLYRHRAGGLFESRMLMLEHMVRAKVTASGYTSECEVIRDGLRAPGARDQAMEGWLRQEVVTAYDRLKGQPRDRALS